MARILGSKFRWSGTRARRTTIVVGESNQTHKLKFIGGDEPSTSSSVHRERTSGRGHDPAAMEPWVKPQGGTACIRA